MNQMNDRPEIRSRESTVLCKNIDKRMNDMTEKRRAWIAIPSSDFVWEVFSVPNVVVDLRQSTCSCRD